MICGSPIAGAPICSFGLPWDATWTQLAEGRALSAQVAMMPAIMGQPTIQPSLMGQPNIRPTGDK